MLAAEVRAQQGSEDDVYGWKEYSALAHSGDKCKYCNLGN